MRMIDFLPRNRRDPHRELIRIFGPPGDGLPEPSVRAVEWARTTLELAGFDPPYDRTAAITTLRLDRNLSERAAAWLVDNLPPHP